MPAIQAPNPVSFPQSRPQRREREADADFKFAHWVAENAEANDSGGMPFPMAMMSPEDILILAQAEEEEYAMAAKIYSDVAEKIEVRDENQMEFEFMLLEHVVSEDI